MVAMGAGGVPVIITGDRDRPSYGTETVASGGEWMASDDVPNLGDPATWGWLAALILEETGIWPGVGWAPDARVSDAEVGTILARALLNAWGES